MMMKNKKGRNSANSSARTSRFYMMMIVAVTWPIFNLCPPVFAWYQIQVIPTYDDDNDDDDNDGYNDDDDNDNDDGR